MLVLARLCFLFLWLGLTTSAFGQICGSYPYALTNGTTADANQVMGDFNHVRNCVNNLPTFMRGSLSGLTMANNATTPATVINTSAGVANSDDSSTLMSLVAFSKNADAPWAVGSGNGCLDSGSSLVANTWYHLFVIARTDTGVVDQLCSTSATAPSLPSNYTKKRRIGSFKTDGATDILAFTQLGDEFLWATAKSDVAVTNPGTAAVLRTLSVPTGIKVVAKFNIGTQAGTSNSDARVYVSSPDQTDQAVSATSLNAGSISTGAASQVFGQMLVRTSTAAQVRTRNAATTADTSLFIGTVGWVDHRGQYD